MLQDTLPRGEAIAGRPWSNAGSGARAQAEVRGEAQSAACGGGYSTSTGRSLL